MKKFILNEEGNHAVKAELIEEIYLDPEEFVESLGRRDDSFTVEVALSGADYSITMAKFESKNAEKNYQAAKAYLAELVEKLNGGAL